MRRNKDPLQSKTNKHIFLRGETWIEIRHTGRMPSENEDRDQGAGYSYSRNSKDHRQTTEAKKEPGTGSSLEGTNPASTWIWTCEMLSFCCSKPPSLWCIFTAALAHQHSYQLERHTWPGGLKAAWEHHCQPRPAVLHLTRAI